MRRKFLTSLFNTVPPPPPTSHLQPPRYAAAFSSGRRLFCYTTSSRWSNAFRCRGKACFTPIRCSTVAGLPPTFYMSPFPFSSSSLSFPSLLLMNLFFLGVCFRGLGFPFAISHPWEKMKPFFSRPSGGRSSPLFILFATLPDIPSPVPTFPSTSKFFRLPFLISKTSSAGAPAFVSPSSPVQHSLPLRRFSDLKAPSVWRWIHYSLIGRRSQGFKPFWYLKPRLSFKASILVRGFSVGPPGSSFSLPPKVSSNTLTPSRFLPLLPVTRCGRFFF